MVRDWIIDPYNSALAGAARYGHNHSGALGEGLAACFIELVLLVALLRPWSFDRSWGRALGALALTLPWTVFSMVITMHAGGIVAIHFLWLCFVVVLLLAALVMGLLPSRDAAPR